jgi:hypothetical protein
MKIWLKSGILCPGITFPSRDRIPKRKRAELVSIRSVSSSMSNHWLVTLPHSFRVETCFEIREAAKVRAFCPYLSQLTRGRDITKMGKSSHASTWRRTPQQYAHCPEKIIYVANQIGLLSEGTRLPQSTPNTNKIWSTDFGKHGIVSQGSNTIFPILAGILGCIKVLIPKLFFTKFWGQSMTFKRNKQHLLLC